MNTPQQEYDASIFYTNEAKEQYQNWLSETLGTDDIEIVDAPQYADFDYYVFVNRELHHLLEVKTRRHSGGKYSQEKTPIRKHAVAAFFMREYKIKTIYLVSWTDRIALLELWKLPDRVSEMVARYDRGNDKDIYAMYDYTQFKLVVLRRRAAPPRFEIYKGMYREVPAMD